MLISTFWIFGAGGVLALLCYCVVAGFRDGDRPGDALVAAVLAGAAQPDEDRPLIAVTVRNRSDAPVLAALRARRALLPALLADPHSISVPWRTRRRKFRPGRYATVGVVAACGAAGFTVPVPDRARRYVLTAAVGQQGRLRVHKLWLGPVSRTAEGRQIIMVG